jgi:Holliday junction DNA helicase RuvA
MIGFLKGEVHSIDNTALIVMTGGVGYKVTVPLSIATGVVEQASISLFIYTHVREDQLSLFGFSSKEELFLFEKLISVSGIGPKSALAMLSVHSPASLAEAIESSNSETLSHTPGVGKKTAEKIILELKGKVTHLLNGTTADSTLEVRLALEALGYSTKEIHSALKELKDVDTKTTSILIREALSLLQ